MSTLHGHLLVADPRLLDSFFTRSVVLILAHSDDGTAGLVINRPTEATVSDLSQSIFQGSFVWDKPISLAGPVSGPLVILHGEAAFADHEVVAGVYSTVQDDKVREALRGRVEPSIVAINYAGWGPGQLERELEDDSWGTLPATADLVFAGPDVDLWKLASGQVHARKLQDLINLRGLPEDPRWN